MKRKIFAWMTALCFSFFALTLHVFAEETEVRVTDEDSGQPEDSMQEAVSDKEIDEEKRTHQEQIESEMDGEDCAVDTLRQEQIIEEDELSEQKYYAGQVDPNGFRYTVSDDQVTITGYSGNKTELVIPSLIEGFPVTTIDEDAFYLKWMIKSIVIPNSVTKIYQGAFAQCESITEITIPGSVQYMGDGVFLGCKKIASVQIQCELTEIRAYTFAQCTNLAEVKVPYTVKWIHSDAFASCTKLTGIILPSSITRIDQDAFGNCTKLEKVVFEGNCPALSEMTFSDNMRLTAYYPKDNETWTAEKLKNYGAQNIEWIPYSHEHDWTDWEIIKPATCTEAGEEERVCRLDESHKETRTIEALGHSLTKIDAVPAMCTSTGNSEYWICERCGKCYSDEDGNNEIEEDSWIIPATGHDFDEWTVSKEPSCLEEGTETRVCKNDPEHVETRPVEALGHDLVHTEAVPAGCETEGNTEYWTCQRCGKYFSDSEGKTEINKNAWIIPAIGHDYGEWETITSATCTEDGLERRVCSHDNSHIEERTLPASGHDFGEWTVSKEPTCLEEGIETRVCENDPEHVETRPVEALGHDLVHTEAVPAGCETEGNIEYWTCQRCGKYFSDAEGKTEINQNVWIIPAIGHDYGEWETVTPATCTEEGLERRVCTHDSSHTEERTLPATGHNYGNWETVKEPTCTEEGQKQQVCANDSSHVNTETIPAIGHKWGSWITGKQPTCKEEGYEFRVCENDSSHTETNTLAKIPHSWGEWTVVKSPTFEEEGITERTCSVCGEKQTTTIPVISHEHTFTFIEAKDATCEEEGNIAYYYCSVCDRYYKDEEANEKIMPEDVVIPALGHDYGEWETISTATCTEDGLERRVCTHDSSHTEERTLPAAGHNYGNWVIVKEPDCEEEGLKQQICANDSSHVNTESIPALGHKWGNWTRTKEPSCTEEGEEVRVCENNEEHKETNTVSALGHSLTKTEAKAPTVKEEGNTEYWTCERCGKYFSDEAGEHEIEKDSWIIPKLAVPESLEISEGEKIELATLDTQQLTVKILPENADISVIWTSSNEKVASVDENGVVTANIYGKVTITAVSKVNPELKDTIEVQTRFHDVNDSTQSYYKPVYWGADNGVVAGYDGGVYFGPDNDCTRAQFVTFLWRLAGRQTGDKDVSFPDVDPNESYYRAVKWAVSEGIIVGYKHEDGPATFEPNGTVTRGQVATMLWRFAGRKTPDLPSTSPFSDIDASNSSYRAVVWGQKAGVIRGYKDGTFQPDASCLRQHIVTFLYRYARDVMGRDVN